MIKISKFTDNNQHFYCPITEHKDIYKRIHAKKLQKQFAGSRQNNKKSNHKLSTNVKQPPMLSSQHYINHKPYQKSCITKTLPSYSMHPDSQTPINHIKPPKPKRPNPITAHYPHPVTTNLDQPFFFSFVSFGYIYLYFFN